MAYLNEKTLVVNFFGSPGAGKSTGAAYVFSLLKMMGINAELITEYMKGKAWEDNQEIRKPMNQVYVFSKQLYALNRCMGKADVVIVDSPLPLSILYNTSPVLGEDFNKTVMNCFNSFNNLNYFINRVKPYNTSGRFHSEEQSNQLADNLKHVINDRCINIRYRDGEDESYKSIADEIAEKLFESNTITWGEDNKIVDHVSPERN
ncbi:MAG: hypothetical protein Q4F95_02265 [Oscillospiraceae bacterium]|nr:hypothetical protein [Oscillospiraceae bacterium]